MKKLIIAFLFAFIPSFGFAQAIESATEAVKNMGLGWNLGNTLDASSGNQPDYTKDNYWGQQGLESENFWGQPKTTSDLLAMMKKAGFGAIRVPVTWYNHMDKNGKVDAAWMARVHEVVDYVIDNGMYCLLNVHHDTGAGGTNHTAWLRADASVYSAQKARYEYLWKQIAEEFKDYDGKLLFEAYNEMLDTYNSWCFASFAAPGNYNATVATSAYNGLNSYAQSFVNTVRGVGGKNSNRNLVVNTYAASCGTGNWSSHLQEPLDKMKLPTDNVANHLIFEVHCYPSMTTNDGKSDRSITDIKKEVDELVSVLKTRLVSKGAPVIIGEWGTGNNRADGKSDFDGNPELVKQFYDYFIKQTKANGMGAFHWMGLTDGVYRSFPAFSQAELAECMAKAYHGSDFKGEYPVNDGAVVVFEGDKLIGWGNGISIPASLIKDCGEKVSVELTYSQEGGGDDIQIMYGDWNKLQSFIVDGKTFNGDFSPHAHYGAAIGVHRTTSFTFSPAVYEVVAQKGLIIHGYDVRLYKAELKRSNPTGIETISTSTSADNTVYNLAGQRVSRPTKGIYIIGGKKIAVR